ncbi:MAG TPA: aldehyde dehydrogenase family protein [Chloroflexota bacterium]|jgi:glutamate-5-semialdehyde dehydrogenase|nr:aldehyde dehydrogenase family protein [Chloroflexota bacterium]
MSALDAVQRGMPLLYGGNRVRTVPDEVADAFRPGDYLVVVQDTGDVLHIPGAVYGAVDGAVRRAGEAFSALAVLPDAQIDAFYEAFASALAQDAIWEQIGAANAEDVTQARARGRSTTRLEAGESMRAKMIEGLRLWRDLPSRREAALETVTHEGWRVEQVVSGVGVVGFVFEGRPNVFADATGVLRSGNTAVMRIGSDALGTARAIDSLALRPALRAAGLPEGAVALIDNPQRAAGWALFANPGLALAVARGSGAAVAQLGAVARQAGTPVSLHGTGGAWIVADATADAGALARAVYHSLDSKKCNTLNTLCVVQARAAELVPGALEALRRRGEQLGHGHRLHVTDTARPYVPPALFAQQVPVLRAGGETSEPLAQPAGEEALGTEWEWEGTPEVTLHVVPDVEAAVALFNRHSPRFVASLVSEDEDSHERFFRAVDAPFVGNGFTRWVDGQFALRRPELGLSSWQFGRLFARPGILTGDGVYTVRLRAVQDDPDIHT